MKLSAILITFLFVGCGDVEDGAVDVDFGSDNEQETSEKAGTGIDDKSVGETSDTVTEGEHAGDYVLSSVTANDGYNMYYYSLAGGQCGMKLVTQAELKYRVLEDNDCSLRDHYGDQFEWVDAADWVAVLDKFGAVIDIESLETSGSTGGEGAEILSFELRFTDTRAVMKSVKVVGGYEVEYTYNYTKL